MIINKNITEKICDKTSNDPIMQEFITNLISIEMRTSNYKTPYNTEIKKTLKKRGC